jgi:hypothetical protein
MIRYYEQTQNGKLTPDVPFTGKFWVAVLSLHSGAIGNSRPTRWAFCLTDDRGSGNLAICARLQRVFALGVLVRLALWFGCESASSGGFGSNLGPNWSLGGRRF